MLNMFLINDKGLTLVFACAGWQIADHNHR
jgi:hypothetical protein